MRLCLASTVVSVLTSVASAALAQPAPSPAPQPPVSPETSQPPPAAAPSADEGGGPKPAPVTPPPVKPFEPPAAELLPAAPPEAPPPPAGEKAPSADDLGSYQSHWQVELGVRSSYITNPGFDPFAGNNSLIQSTLGFGRTLGTSGPYSIAAFLYWEYGGRSDTARGDPSSLGTHRWGLGPELRWHLIPQIYLFGRPALTLHYIHTEIEDSVAQTTLHSRKTSMGFDLSLGAAFHLAGRRSADGPSPRLWAIGEGGYGWSAAVSQRFRPDKDDSGSPARVVPVGLGPLALRGGYFKLGLALTY
jgi:hypothetical protein